MLLIAGVGCNNTRQRNRSRFNSWERIDADLTSATKVDHHLASTILLTIAARHAVQPQNKYIHRNMHTYVYMHAYIISIHTHMHTMHIYIYIHTADAYTSLHTYIYTCMYPYIHPCWRYIYKLNTWTCMQYMNIR